MSASSSVIAAGAVVVIMLIALLGTRWTYRPIKGRAAVVLTRTMLGIAAVTFLATLGVFALILRAQ